MALHGISLLTHRRLIDDIERRRDEGRLIRPPAALSASITPVDFAHADALIDRTLRAAQRFVDGGGERRAPHSHAVAPTCARATAARVSYPCGSRQIVRVVPARG